MGEPLDDLVPQQVYARMVELRRELHRYPELSFKEHQTADRIGARLDDLGIAHRRVAQTGIVADLPGQHEGPIVALRGDTDALPIVEETGLPFSSEHHGVMHACGHDGHASMLVGAAELLVANPAPLPVRLLWQPAEEKGAGAKAMVAEGVLEGVAAIFGGHLDRHYPPGTLVITDGAVNASTDHFIIRIRGQQGHGARPHEALDAVVVGSLLVTAIQTIVSREINPAHPSVITVGSFTAGTAPNVIAGSATLEGTIRSQDNKVREHLIGSLQRVAQAIGQLHDANVTFELVPGTPALLNDPAVAEVAREAARMVIAPEGVIPMPTANMGGEDFAVFLERVPGCYIRFGSQIPGRENFPAHSSQWDFDETALAIAARWFEAVAHQAARRLLEGTFAGGKP